MNIHFLGTSASEGWPSLFCRCASCLKARELGGRNIRSRTSVLIDGVVKIDFPPDTFYHVVRDNIDLGAVKHLLFTHSHRDHFYPADLECRLTRWFAQNIDREFHIYGDELVLAGSRAVLASSQQAGFFHPEDRMHYRMLKPFVPIALETGKGTYNVTPLLANHDREETCLLFYIEKDGKAYLHANDTGWLPEETWAWLEGKRMDMATFDCTGGHVPDRPKGQRPGGHLNMDAVIEMTHIFRDKKLLHENSRVFATHFSHEIGLTHDEMVEIFKPHGIQPAYDSLRVDL